MYRTTMTETASSFSESKYVADILRNMANGDPAMTSTTYSISPYVSGITSVTTPTLTPTTLASIEQTFIELQSVPVNSSSGQDPLTQSGFVPPIVSMDPVSGSDNSRFDDISDSSDDPEWDTPVKRARTDSSGKVIYQLNGETSSPKRKRRSRNEKLSPEEEARRRIRRERNKVAAAKCRQRRVDHTNRLLEETDKLEGEKGNLENEILSLQQQKDQLEFILQAHKPMCTDNVKTEPGTSPCSRTPVSSAAQNSSLRPTSLPILKREKSEVVSTATGIPITTPSSGFYTFSLDSIVDSTGLTPLTGQPTTCSSEQRSSSESGSEHVTSPSLISL